MLHDILEGKNVFPEYKNNKLKKPKNWDFSKAGKSMVLVKNWTFSSFLF